MSCEVCDDAKLLMKNSSNGFYSWAFSRGIGFATSLSFCPEEDGPKEREEEDQSSRVFLFFFTNQKRDLLQVQRNIYFETDFNHYAH
eukprot:Seg438.6 transcript_id=Seg438.6/GoldUCD/mRNA.D3Y31 product="hypothetical protein" protein_id=Seg438.6/GoldUCD/D3Y31